MQRTGTVEVGSLQAGEKAGTKQGDEIHLMAGGARKAGVRPRKGAGGDASLQDEDRRVHSGGLGR